jgi:hypothetical protein
MASVYTFPNGLGGTTGDDLCVASGPVYATVAPLYIDSVHGSGSGDGSREYPYASLATTVGLGLSQGQTFVLLAGHTETLTASLALNVANLWIVGEGSGSSMPKLTAGAGSGSMLNCTGAGMRIRGIYFPASAASVTARVKLDGTGQQIQNCYFECGGNDNFQAVNIVGNGATERIIRITGSTFVSTSTDPTARPKGGVEVITAALTELDIDDCVFDGGTVGFSDWALEGTQSVTRLNVFASFLNGADQFWATSSVGRSVVTVKSGNPAAFWTA